MSNVTDNRIRLRRTPAHPFVARSPRSETPAAVRREPLPRKDRIGIAVAVLFALSVSWLGWLRPGVTGIAKQREAERIAAEKVARASGGVAAR